MLPLYPVGWAVAAIKEAVVTTEQTEAMIRGAQQAQREIEVGDAAMEIARTLHRKGYQVEVLAPHIALIIGEEEEQIGVRLRWIAPGQRAGTEAVVIHKAIQQMKEAAKILPDARAAGLLTPYSPRNKPKSFA